MLLSLNVCVLTVMGFENQGLMLAGQVLCLLSHTPVLTEIFVGIIICSQAVVGNGLERSHGYLVRLLPMVTICKSIG